MIKPFKKVFLNKTENLNEKYAKETQEWHFHVVAAQRLWLYRSLIATIALICLLFLSIITNVTLLPLKQKVPYLLSVNTTTGELTQIGELVPSQINNDWALIRFLIGRYVTAREGFDIDNIEQPYQIAWTMSDEKIASQYANEASSENPSSPYQRFGKNQFVTVKVLSISKLNDNTASVRFELTLHDRNNDTQKQTQKEGIVRWRFDTKNQTQKMLDRDPLGFKVTYYQTTSVNLDQ